MNGFKAWRNNTLGVWDAKKGVYRKNRSQLNGIADVIGFRKSDGKFIAVEVKTGKDSLSSEQTDFLQCVEKGNGIAIVAKTFEQFLQCYKSINL